MKSNSLTKKQQEVLLFTKSYIEKNERSPYIREIQDACRIVSYKSVVDKLLALERKGYIKRTMNKHRSIKIVGGAKEPAAVA